MNDKVIDWCNDRGMEIEYNQNMTVAKEPGLTIFHDGSYTFEIKNPNIGLLTTVKAEESDVIAIGELLCINKENNTRTVLKSTRK